MAGPHLMSDDSVRWSFQFTDKKQRQLQASPDSCDEPGKFLETNEKVTFTSYDLTRAGSR